MLAALAIVVAAATDREAVGADRSTQRGFVETRALIFPQDAANDADTSRRRSAASREEVFVQADRLAADRRRRRRAGQHARPGRRILGARHRRSRRATTGAVGPPAGGDGDPWTVDARRRQAVHPLGQSRHRDADGSIRAARLPERHRQSSFWRVRGVRARAGMVSEHVSTRSWVPFFTPSRMPLLDQRWTPCSGASVELRGIVEGARAAARLAGRGALESHGRRATSGRCRTSTATTTCPTIARDASPLPNPRCRASRSSVRTRRLPAHADDRRRRARCRRAGSTIKGEAAYFIVVLAAGGRLRAVRDPARAPDRRVVAGRRLRRRSGDRAARASWCSRPIAAARAIVRRPRRLHASTPIAASAIEASCGRTAEASTSRASSRRAYGPHWRTTVTGAVIGGDADDFLGQYRRNSHVSRCASLQLLTRAGRPVMIAPIRIDVAQPEPDDRRRQQHLSDVGARPAVRQLDRRGRRRAAASRRSGAVLDRTARG